MFRFKFGRQIPARETPVVPPDRHHHGFCRWELLFVMALLLFAAVSHGWNMFQFPYFENDEATYFSQAFSFYQDGRLAPYTYWYDHAPVGWILTAGWLWVTGGPFTFGFSLYSARIWMWLIHILAAGLLYVLARRVTKSRLAAATAVLLFSISPLAVYFQRRMLLDNLMVFWMLLTLNLVVYARQRLWWQLASAVSFGLAVLTKENAIFFLPVLVVLVTWFSHRRQRLFAVVLWLAIAGMVIGLYPLYALLKGELFPAGSWPSRLFNGAAEHVSLLGTLQQQASRGVGVPFWRPESDLRLNLNYWLGQDPFLVIGGGVTFLFQLLLAIKYKASRVIVLMTLPMLLFLMSGRLVINFYLVPLIPFWVLGMGASLAVVSKWLARLHRSLAVLLLLLCAGIITYYYAGHQVVKNMWQSTEAQAQVDAVNWVKQNLDPQSVMVVDYGMIDLMHSRFPGDPDFVNADWYWKVDFDSDIRDRKLNRDPTKIEYLMVTQQMYKDTASYRFSQPLTQQALAKSTLLEYFGPPYPPQDSLGEFVQNFANGDWVAIYRQNSIDDVLRLSWESYVKEAVTAEGRVRDSQPDQTSSRNVGYTLLRSVWSDDQASFDRVWRWAQAELQNPATGVFFAQIRQRPDGSVVVHNPASDSEADQLIAYALSEAAQRWNEPDYLAAVRQLLAGIWRTNTVAIAGQRYLVAGSWTAQAGRPRYVLSSSSFLPFAYDRFAAVDPNRDWNGLADQMWATLERCSQLVLSEAANGRPTAVSTTSSLSAEAPLLPPDWCDLSASGQVLPRSEVAAPEVHFGYEAHRLLWSLGVAVALEQDQRAAAYLRRVTQFSQDWQQRQQIETQYRRDGQPVKAEASLDNYASMVSYLVGRGELSHARQLYEQQLSPYFQRREDRYGWGILDQTGSQNWLWLNTWLFNTAVVQPGR